MSSNVLLSLKDLSTEQLKVLGEGIGGGFAEEIISRITPYTCDSYDHPVIVVLNKIGGSLGKTFFTEFFETARRKYVTNTLDTIIEIFATRFASELASKGFIPLKK